MRALVDLAFAEGFRLELCWSGVRGAQQGVTVVTSDGDGGEQQFYSELPEEDLARLLRRCQDIVPASSPLLVFGDSDAVLQASLEFPGACAVLADQGRDPGELLQVLLEVLDKVGYQRPEFALAPDVLRTCLNMPEPGPGDRGILHFAGTGEDPGSQVLLRCLRNRSQPVHLRLVLTGASAATRELWCQQLDSEPDLSWELLTDVPSPAHFAGCIALVQPDSQHVEWQTWMMAMATRRVLVAGRHADSARLLKAPGICLPLGGRKAEGQFLVDPRCLDHALTLILDESPAARAKMRASAERARTWAQMHLDPEQPATKAAPRTFPRRPLVVLEAPMLERSSSSILTLETALALQRSGMVELRLCPSRPFKEDLAAFRQRYPSLVCCLSRPPAAADLWLRSGWPVLPHRPDASCFAVRIDWEYGSLPTELTPLVTEEADRVIVHSRVVQRALVVAGCDPARVVRIPHGVDAQTFNQDADALDRVMAFKRDKYAVLFVGELIWRKGFDLWVKTLLMAAKNGLPVCAVVKTPGGGSKYRGFEMRELLDRCLQKAPFLRILTIEEDLSGAEMAGLYRACDLLFHPYRGEGFCLPVLEAGACGLPVLATAGGSTDDFHDPALGIPAVRRYVDLPGPHEGRPHVLEPDAEQCAVIFADRIARLPELQARCRADAEDLRARHTWDQAAAVIAKLAFDALGVIPRCQRQRPELPMLRGSQGAGDRLPKGSLSQLLRS